MLRSGRNNSGYNLNGWNKSYGGILEDIACLWMLVVPPSISPISCCSVLSPFFLPFLTLPFLSQTFFLLLSPLSDSGQHEVNSFALVYSLLWYFESPKDQKHWSHTAIAVQRLKPWVSIHASPFIISLCVFVIQVEKRLTQGNYERPPLVENILNTFTMCW